MKKKYIHPNGKVEVLETDALSIAMAYEEAADCLDDMASDMRQYPPCNEKERAARFIVAQKIRNIGQRMKL